MREVREIRKSEGRVAQRRPNAARTGRHFSGGDKFSAEKRENCHENYRFVISASGVGARWGLNSATLGVGGGVHIH